MAISTANLTRAFMAAVLAFAIDQGSKMYVMDVLGMVPGDSLVVLPGVVTFVMSWNTGINFGLFADNQQWLRFGLIAFSLVVAGALMVWAARHVDDWVFSIGAGLLTGGALGNALDRAVHGAVADFLNVTCCGIFNPYAFNPADVAIFAGAGLLLLSSGDKQDTSTADIDRRGKEDQ